MKCTHCKSKNSTVSIKISNGKSEEILNLCPECSQPPHLNLHKNNIKSSLPSQKQELSRKQINEEHITCPSCLINLEQIKKNQLAGCANCYSLFNSYFEEKIKLLHDIEEIQKQRSSSKDSQIQSKAKTSLFDSFAFFQPNN